MKRELNLITSDEEFVRESVKLEENETIFLKLKDNKRIVTILCKADDITFIWNKTTKLFSHAFVNGLSIFEVKPFYQELGFGSDVEMISLEEKGNVSK